MTRTGDPARDRLRHMLITRRVELNPGFASRRVFSEHPDTVLSYSAIRDLETGNRANFDESTLLRADMSYRYEAGSIERFLNGGPEPVPLGGVPGSREGSLIRASREARHMSIGAAAAQLSAAAPPDVRLSADEWRSIERGAPVSDTTLAWMAMTVGAGAGKLDDAGRGEAADELRALLSRPPANDEVGQRRQEREQLLALIADLEKALETAKAQLRAREQRTVTDA